MSTASHKPAAAEGLDWNSREMDELLERALAEDIGPGDLTTAAVLTEAVEAAGTFQANASLVVAGLPLAQRLYALLDPSIRFQAIAEEGALVARGPLAVAKGDGRALLRGERTTLNFLQRLCGIATLTRRFALRLDGTKARLLDTRKTTPGLRVLERYAVRAGGGGNHRFGLFDAVLIKENHAELAGGVGAAVRRARRQAAGQKIEAEARDLAEVRDALEAGADAVLLDNMSVHDVREAVRLAAGRAPLEVSGGITLENIRDYAEAGVDFISVGALTHSAPAADISFEVFAGEKRA